MMTLKVKIHTCVLSESSYSNSLRPNFPFFFSKWLFNALPVNIYTVVRSSMDGMATKPCPVTVRVRPNFLRDSSSMHIDPDLELWASFCNSLILVLQHDVISFIVIMLAMFCFLFLILYIFIHDNTSETFHTTVVTFFLLHQCRSRSPEPVGSAAAWERCWGAELH